MSFDGYLALLTELSDRYSSMVCVNRTLPINWLAPIHGKDSSTRGYEAHLKELETGGEFEVRRLTIASRHEISKQLAHTYESLRRSETEPFHCVLWFLEFFQALFDTDQDGLITQVSRWFDQYELEVKDFLLASPDHQVTVDVLSQGIENVCASASDKIEKKFIKAEEMCDILNKNILRKFFAVHGRRGSYYMTKKYFDKSLKGTLIEETYRDVSKYGEIAVYYSRKVPKMAIATVGELGELVGIEIAEASNLSVCIKKCINLAEDIKQKDFAGNFEDLITNDV
ncbi:MAG: hypothetical protein LWX51_06025 [Deltaproteobacteria bacterium]|jgi:hypothetical protein|nr:hypothetical protein [Deltaproteobacteria bacterium]